MQQGGSGGERERERERGIKPILSFIHTTQ
jgi:hypothetical protein